MFNLKSQYRIIEENNKFYPESKVFYLFWSRYIYTYLQSTVCFDSLVEAEKFLKNEISKPEDKIIIHKFKN